MNVKRMIVGSVLLAAVAVPSAGVASADAVVDGGQQPSSSVDADAGRSEPLVPPLTAMAALGVLSTGTAALVTLVRRSRV